MTSTHEAPAHSPATPEDFLGTLQPKKIRGTTDTVPEGVGTTSIFTEYQMWKACSITDPKRIQDLLQAVPNNKIEETHPVVPGEVLWWCWEASTWLLGL